MNKTQHLLIGTLLAVSLTVFAVPANVPLNSAKGITSKGVLLFNQH